MKRKILLGIIIFILFNPIMVLADHIYDIDMDIYIDENGNAMISEIWDVQADGGTEWYKQLNNMGNQEVSDFKVTMDDKELQYKKWDINESLREKSGYYGINYTSSGLELCFGKGDMKRHTFILTYKLSNVIFNTEDSQVLYETLFPEVTLDSFSVVIHSYYEFPDKLEVWGYGYKGYAYVLNGKIEMSQEESLFEDRVVVLIKFPLNTFKTSNTVEEFPTFAAVQSRADEDTYQYDYNNYNGYDDGNYNGGSSAWSNIISMLMYLLFPTALIGAGVVGVINSGYGYRDNKTINKKAVSMFRDIPCNKDIYYANALIYLNNFGYNATNIMGAILLKWIRNNKVIFKNTEKGVFNKKTSVIDLTLNPTFDNYAEKELFDIMYEASKDGILESRELEKWCRSHYDKFLRVFNKLKDSKIDELTANNHIYNRANRNECKKKKVMDDTIYEDSVKLYGLKKYLIEFSNMKEKEAIDVHLWDEYLMFAYLLGIADKVAKQFKNLYPEIVKEMEKVNMDYGTFVFINSISTSSVSAATSARSAASSYSGGGGGFSIGGGGGGSFGGGGSMGGR